MHLEKEMVPLRLYSIYDSKAEQFSPPQVYHNDMLALRAFEGIVNDDKMLIKKYPEDFSLYYIGNLGDCDGQPNAQKYCSPGYEASSQCGYYE